MVALGLSVVSCGDSPKLEPREGAGGAGSSGGAGSGGGGGSVHAGGQKSTGGDAQGAGGFGGNGGAGTTGGFLGFAGSGGKAIDPRTPKKNPGWNFDTPKVDGGPRVCMPIPEHPVYEYELVRAASGGCIDWFGHFAPRVVIRGFFPEGSRVAIPEPAADGCGPRICTCSDLSPDAGPGGRMLDWVCPE